MQREGQKNYAKAVARLNRLAAFAWFALMAERLWLALWPPMGVVLLFLSVSWLGLWPLLSEPVHFGLIAGFILVSLVSTKGLLTLKFPTIQETLQRIDHDSGLPHGEAETFNDRLVMGRYDPTSRALWILHRERAVLTIKKMRVALPHPDMPRHDRYAIRSCLLLIAIASAFIAGPSKWDKLSDAGITPQWFNATSSNTIALSGWIDPPAYTGLAPIILTLSEQALKINIPTGSMLVLQSTKNANIALSAEPALRALEAKNSTASPPSSLNRKSFLITEDSTVTVKSGFFKRTTLTLSVIPDPPPNVSLEDKITVNARGSFTMRYKAQDDYGITALKGVAALAPTYRSLVPPPEISLRIPPREQENSQAEQTVDWRDHPWAGLPVTLTLVAQDAAGQEARSAPISIILPQRPFTVPLAKALAEQRRNLIVMPEGRELAAEALAGLLTAPEQFTPEASLYLGLRHAQHLLLTIQSEADQIALAEWLWAMAIAIEDGSFSESESALRAAQQNLQDALSRKAPPEEMNRLTKELREAMNRYLADLAARMPQTGSQSALQAPNAQTLSQDQISQMFDQIEDLLRQSRTAEAERLLEQLKNIFDNMQMAKPDTTQSDPMLQEMMQALNEANDILSQQQKLRDQTYEQNRQELLYADKEKQKEDKSIRDLRHEQQQLRQKLEENAQQRQRLGLEPDENLAEAESAMREAEEALSSGDGNGAVIAQGQAIDALQKGMNNIMRQAQAMLGGSSAMNNGAGNQQGRFQDPFQGKAATKDTREKLQQLIEQLRNKLSDPNRPKDELDYFDRLLRQ